MTGKEIFKMNNKKYLHIQSFTHSIITTKIKVEPFFSYTLPTAY